MIVGDLLRSLDLEFNTYEWDGFKLKVFYKFDHSTECNRNDLLEYLPELDYSKGDDLGGDLTYPKDSDLIDYSSDIVEFD